jgi:hypothetical protein
MRKEAYGGFISNASGKMKKLSSVIAIIKKNERMKSPYLRAT